jgi:hypothetical protein
MRITVAAFLLLLGGLPAFGSGQLCPRSEIPLSFKIENAPLTAQGLEFGAHLGDAGGVLYLANAGTKPMVAVSILTEFFGKNGDYEFSVDFSWAVRPQILNEPYGHSGGGLLDSPLPPSEEFYIAGGTQLRTRECPARARVTRVDVKFSDRTEYHYSAPGWQKSAEVRFVRPVQTDIFPRPLPLQVAVTVTVDAKGKVSKLATAEQDPSVQAWFESQLRRWTFYPALRAGTPVPSELVLLFRLHRLPERDEPADLDQNMFPESGRLILVDVYPGIGAPPNDQTILVARTPFWP